MQKPGVITTVQVLLWIGVGAAALLTCLALGLMSQASAAGVGGLLAFSLVVAVAGAILNAVVAVNLGERRNWARVTGIVVCSISIAINIITLMSAAPAQVNAGSTIVNTVIQGIVIGCLSSQDAKRWCSE